MRLLRAIWGWRFLFLDRNSRTVPYVTIRGTLLGRDVPSALSGLGRTVYGIDVQPCKIAL